MKVIVEYSLPDDEHEYKLSLVAVSMLSAITESRQRIRNQLKHGQLGNDRRTLEEVQLLLGAVDDI